MAKQLKTLEQIREKDSPRNALMQGGNHVTTRSPIFAVTSEGEADPRNSTESSRGTRRERTVESITHPITPLRYRWYPVFKSYLDRLVALFLLVPAVPVILFSALLIKLTSRGPAFYTQARLGKNGKPFTIYKLRTMIHKCESLTGPRWCIPGDPRITRVGAILRLTHLDELPQLLNVLKGEMGLIGPRPERPEFLPELESALPAYRRRMDIAPGVTGMAQIQLPADTDLESVERKLAYDLYYIQHVTPWMDLKILLGTALYTLGASYRFVQWFLRLPSETIVRARTRPFIEGRSTDETHRKAA